MSGFEIAGILLGAFPLIISGLEHWRDVAKVGGFYWKVRKEYTKCRSDVRFHEICYNRNMKELLLPVVSDADEVARLVSDPAGNDWGSKTLQESLERRLQDSYGLYMDIMRQMNETVEELKNELSFDEPTVQCKLAPPEQAKQQRPPSPQPSSKPSKRALAKSKLDYEAFRIKFSFNEPVRSELFNRLEECNSRLKKLLSTSDTISALQNVAPTNMKQTSVLDTVFKKTLKESKLLFKALENSWQCSCQHHHSANLRLEHRTLPDVCFEVILMSGAPSSGENIPWSWKEIRCGHIIGCPFSHIPIKPSIAPQSPSCLPNPTSSQSPSPRPTSQKQARFVEPAQTIPKIQVEVLSHPSIKLCQLLGDEQCEKCIGIVGHGDETYHLHPFIKRKRPDDSGPLTLDQIISSSFEGYVSRRQRYSIALILASSVLQLQYTPWLKAGLTKEDVLFFQCEDDGCTVLYHEPFIRQGFQVHPETSSNEANDCSLSWLGILLLELCFGKRLEDQPFRKRYPPGEEETKQAFDTLAALKWCQSVGDEGGDDYAQAVKWCFMGGGHANQSWRGEMIKNVLRPLEMCQEHFRTAAVF